MTHLTTEYHQYMRSEAWNEKRLERLRIDGYVCQDCYADDRPLDVHHLKYENFGDEDMDDLISLCRQCHDERHNKDTRVIFGICKTCKKSLAIFTKRVKVLGIWWNDYVCQDGHFWSKKL